MPQIIDRFRSSTAGWLRGSLAGWGTVLLLVIGLLGTFWALAQRPVAAWAWLFPIAFVAGAAILIARWIGNLATTYELTNDRLILHRGVVMKSIDEIELYRIKDIRLDFSIINQLADLGTISMTSSDETTRLAPLVLRDITGARARREKLRELIEAARRQRGVREVDMVREELGEAN